MTDMINKIKELAKKPFFLKAAVAAGLIMIILILVSDFNKEEEKERSDADVNVLSFTSAELYADETEKRLCETLTEIEGVGKTREELKGKRIGSK